MTSKLTTTRILTTLLLALAIPSQLTAAGPAVLDLRSTANFTILSGAAITTTGGGLINGDIGASPIAGSAIGIPAAQVVGTIYAVDASGPAGSVIDPIRLTAAKGDLTTAYNDAAGRTPVPSGPFLNPGAGNIGGLVLVPGLYKFTGTALITGADLTLVGGADDVWIFQCAADLQLGSGIKVILAGGAQAKNIFWQVGTSAVLGTFSVFKGTILADQAITMNTSSTMDGRALAFSAGVTFNGTGAALPTAPEIAVSQPLGSDLVDGVSTRNFGSALVGGSTSLIFTITNSGDANLTGLGITIDGLDAALFSVTASPVAPVTPAGSTTFTVSFTPLTGGVKAAALHIANNDSDEGPFDIILAGTGVVPAPEIAVSQPLGTDLTDGVSSKDFGSALVGASTSLTFTITNSGNANLTGLGITIDGLDAALFSVTLSPVAPVLPAGSTTFTVRFAPLTAGVKAAALHIANNDLDEGPFDIALTGTGALVPTPEIAVSQPLGTDLTDGVSSKDFGTVPVGGSSSLTFTITNSGTADLTLTLPITFDGADAAQFSVTTPPTTPVIPGGSTTFAVRFAPLSAGVKAAALHLVNNDSDESPFDLALTGTGSLVAVPEIAVSQPLGTDLTDGVSSKDFGVVVVGGSASLTFTITNSGTADLTGLGITIDGLDAALFTVTLSPVAPVIPAGSTTFTVRFAPLAAGVKVAALHIANNDADEGPFDIALTGTGSLVPVPEIAVSQPLGTDLVDGVSTKDFGIVPVGASSSLVFTITNSGTADLTILGPITFDGADAAQFSVTSPPSTPVIPGGSTTFIVRFTPLTGGLKVAALHLVNNDSDESPFDITLTGTGTTAPEIAVSQPLGTDLTDGVSSRDFGVVSVGGNSSLTFTITNSGTANLTGLGITFDGADAALFSVTASPAAPVVPAGSTTFTVRFAPLTAGAKAAALHIASNDGDESPFDLSLTGTSVAPEIAVSQPLGTDLADGGSQSFGPVLVGAATSLTFTITNSGTANLTGLGITIDGVDAALFTVTVAPVAPVVPAGSTTFTVRFAPLTVGAKTAALHLANNDSDEGPFDLTLTATGIAPEIGVAQPLGTDLVDGGGKDFGPVLVGTTTSLTFTITNSGSANLTGLGLTIDGVDAALFTVTAAPVGPLLPASSTTFTVQFAPLVPGLGVKTAALHLASNDGDENPFDLTLTGTGTGAFVTLVSPVTLNPQTGMFEQRVQVTNSSAGPLAAIRLLITGLPADVQVRNASGTNGSSIPFVQHNFPVVAFTAVDFLIEYFRPSRVPFATPTFVTEVTTATPATATGPILEIARNVQLASGRFLIDFIAVPGSRYAVQYSSDLITWKTASPTIPSPDDRVQWYDDGPPKTESLPGSIGSRFYRVIQLP